MVRNWFSTCELVFLVCIFSNRRKASALTAPRHDRSITRPITRPFGTELFYIHTPPVPVCAAPDSGGTIHGPWTYISNLLIISGDTTDNELGKNTCVSPHTIRLNILFSGFTISNCPLALGYVVRPAECPKAMGCGWLELSYSDYRDGAEYVSWTCIWK